MDWPKVLPDDQGIRPAGPSDACFYCGRRVGEEHQRTCVTVVKKVKIVASIELEIDVPHHWDESNVNFYQNDSSWCASNIIKVLQELDVKETCLCRRYSADFIEVLDSTPRRAEK